MRAASRIMLVRCMLFANNAAMATCVETRKEVQQSMLLDRLVMLRTAKSLPDQPQFTRRPCLVMPAPHENPSAT